MFRPIHIRAGHVAFCWPIAPSTDPSIMPQSLEFQMRAAGRGNQNILSRPSTELFSDLYLCSPHSCLPVSNDETEHDRKRHDAKQEESSDEQLPSNLHGVRHCIMPLHPEMPGHEVASKPCNNQCIPEPPSSCGVEGLLSSVNQEDLS